MSVAPYHPGRPKHSLHDAFAFHGSTYCWMIAEVNYLIGLCRLVFFSFENGDDVSSLIPQDPPISESLMGGIR